MNKLFLVCCVVFIVGQFSVDMYMDSVDVLSITESESQTLSLLSLIRNIAFWICCFLIVVTSMYEYFSKPSRKNVVIVCLALGFNLFVIIGLAKMSNALSSIPKTSNLLIERHPDLLDDYQGMLDSKDFDLDELARITPLMADTFYIDSGEIVNIILSDGTQVKFQPSRESLKMRSDLLRLEAVLDYQSKSAMTGSFITTGVLLFAFICGWFSTWIVSTYNKRFVSSTDPEIKL